MKKYIVLFIISLVITSATPFVFKNYVEKKPEDLTQSFTFGGPIPFAEQFKVLPDTESSYPLEIAFTSPAEAHTTIHPIPFIFALIVFYLIILSLYTVIGSYFKKGQKKQKS